MKKASLIKVTLCIMSIISFLNFPSVLILSHQVGSKSVIHTVHTPRRKINIQRSAMEIPFPSKNNQFFRSISTYFFAFPNLLLRLFIISFTWCSFDVLPQFVLQLIISCFLKHRQQPLEAITIPTAFPSSFQRCFHFNSIFTKHLYKVISIG